MKNSTAFVLLMVSVGVFYTFISPNYEKVQSLREQSQKYKDTLSSIEELNNKRDDLQVKYENTPQAEIVKLEKVLPGNVDTVNLAMNFDAIASNYGISIKSIRTVEDGNETGADIIQDSDSASYGAVSVSFSFVATYEDFRNFIADIEKSLRIIDIKSVTFNPSESGLYEFNVSVDTYWLKQ